MSNPLAALAASLCDPSDLKLDPSQWEDFRHDATDLCHDPAGVLVATSVEDVVAAVRYCATHRIPVTARGAGTGLSGGCVPSDHALVISTQRLDALRIDAERRLAVCGPGVITSRVQEEAARVGLAYPPDPASYAESCLGGNVAEGAGGLRCKRFGTTKDYVIGLKAVTADGRVLSTGTYCERRGFSLCDLLVASEGTLGIIIEIAVRLVPIFGTGATMLMAFEHPRDAAQTVTDITTAGLIPSVLEFLDGDAAACSNAYEKTEGLNQVGALLLLETDDRTAACQADQITVVARRNRARWIRVESDSSKAESLWKVRRNLSKAVKAIARVRISEDVAVPNSQFPALVAFVAEMNQSSPLRINAFGHAGDGNLHVNFLSESGSEEQIRLIYSGIDVLLNKTLELGGTISGEHGIGLAKREYLGREFDSPTLSAMRELRRILDPANLLNPDKLLPV